VYAYVRHNPIGYWDPDGLAELSKEQRQELIDQIKLFESPGGKNVPHMYSDDKGLATVT
jgi:hypothetical protein